MKIQRVKTFSQFRSLEPGFEISFKPDLSSDDADFVCLVGANGSGKSNVLELIAEIFACLESNRLQYFKEGITHNALNSFEIEYYLPLRWGNRVLRMDDSFTFQDKYFHVLVTKEVSGWPKYFVGEGDKIREIKEDELVADLLPRKVWGYSSGYNEMISLPFWRTDVKYISRLKKTEAAQTSGFVEESRLHFVDYETSAFILLSNFIRYKTDSGARLNIFKELFDVVDLVSFKFSYRKYSESKNSNSLIVHLERFVDTLKSKLPTDSIEEDGDVITFNVTLDNQVINAFNDLTLGASGLYRLFETLNLTNLLPLTRKKTNEILLDGYEFSIDYGPIQFKQERRPFQINEILVRKGTSDTLIQYRSLSDGEHQAITLIGLMNIIDEEASLYLLDEPETHLNPKWKYSLVDSFNTLLKAKQSQVFISTHDPLLISGLRKENVIQFSNKKIFQPVTDVAEEVEGNKFDLQITDLSQNLLRYKYAEADFLGKGVDAILTSDLFGLRSTIDQATQKKLEQRMELLGRQLRGNQLSESEEEILERLTDELQNIDAFTPTNDPVYREVIANMTGDEIVEIMDKESDPIIIARRKEISDRVLKRLRNQE